MVLVLLWILSVHSLGTRQRFDHLPPEQKLLLRISAWPLQIWEEHTKNYGFDSRRGAVHIFFFPAAGSRQFLGPTQRLIQIPGVVPQT